jgi:hypothetical protein
VQRAITGYHQDNEGEGSPSSRAAMTSTDDIAPHSRNGPGCKAQPDAPADSVSPSSAHSATEPNTPQLVLSFRPR